MNTCKKHCFFNAKSLPMPPGEESKRPKVCSCRQTYFWEKIKTKIEKVKFAHLSNDTRPKVGLLEKRFQKWAFRLDETRGFQKWAFRLDETLRKYRYTVNYYGFERKTWWKKKSKKVKSNKTYVFYWSWCKSEHFSWEGCKQNRGHQITTTKDSPWAVMVLQKQNEG